MGISQSYISRLEKDHEPPQKRSGTLRLSKPHVESLIRNVLGKTQGLFFSMDTTKSLIDYNKTITVTTLHLADDIVIWISDYIYSKALR